jgi:folate-binding protein YgfZ
VDPGGSPDTSGIVAGPWPRDVLVVQGPDAVSYLQGQVSADVQTLDPGQSTLALLLGPTGKTDAFVRLWRTDEHVVVIDTDPGAGDAVEARIKRFMLRTDATVERLDWECVAVRGDGSVGPGGAPEVDIDGSGAELVGLCMWPGVDGVDLLGPAVTPPPGVAAVSAQQLEVMRIRAGWPVHGAEIDEGTIPAEIGPWLITAAVSFTKGCYVGQELTARIDSRGGNVPRHLRTFEQPSGHPIARGDSIVVAGGDGEPKGTVTSAAVDPATGRTVAMGFVHRSVPDDAELSAVPTRL